ncbi:MAG TPA: LamG-like jellyroll fold domain-containing protein [Candidatus Binatia bacterium]|jgi:hypothetical protein
MKKRLAVWTLCFAAVCGSAQTSAAATNVVADYRFRRDLTSDVASAPDLTPIGPGQNCFVIDKVGTQLRNVLEFPTGDGVQVAWTALDPLIPLDHYSIAFRFHFDGFGGYQRLVSFDGGVADCGLYSIGNVMTFFCGSGNTNIPFPADGYYDVVFTRASGGVVNGYINGNLALQFTDTTALSVIGVNESLRFFRDNECPAACNENRSGTVSRIRLYDDALTADQVTALETPLATTTTMLEPTCGDANESDTITAADALAALRSSVGTGCCRITCDVNSSGSVTASDALAILKRAVGQGVTLTCPF